MTLKNKRVATLATSGVEQIELTEPIKALRDNGAKVELIGLTDKPIQGFDHDEKGDTFDVDRAVSDVSSSDYDGLFLPGGVANPDRLRTNSDAVRFVRDFFSEGKPVGAICHAPALLIEAGVVEGRTLTSYPSLRTDIKNAGGTWVDKEVCVDSGLVTSRSPRDLPAFCRKLVEEISEGKHRDQSQKTQRSRFEREKIGASS